MVEGADTYATATATAVAGAGKAGLCRAISAVPSVRCFSRKCSTRRLITDEPFQTHARCAPVPL